MNGNNNTLLMCTLYFCAVVFSLCSLLLLRQDYRLRCDKCARLQIESSYYVLHANTHLSICPNTEQLFETCKKHHKKSKAIFSSFTQLISIVSWRFDSIRFDAIKSIKQQIYWKSIKMPLLDFCHRFIAHQN